MNEWMSDWNIDWLLIEWILLQAANFEFDLFLITISYRNEFIDLIIF